MSIYDRLQRLEVRRRKIRCDIIFRRDGKDTKVNSFMIPRLKDGKDEPVQIIVQYVKRSREGIL